MSDGANGSQLIGNLQVWIDPDLCTGDGICTDIAPDVFEMGDDGIAYVKEGDTRVAEGGRENLVNVPAGQEGIAVEAAAECPGECIFFVDGTTGADVGLDVVSRAIA